MGSNSIRRGLVAVAVAAALAAGARPAPAAADFGIAFAWGDIPLCTSGYPNTVPNPTFQLSGVPKGTKEIRFALTDLDVPGYDHGGGTVTFTGQNTVRPGAFHYQSPCPPDGSHQYEWAARAVDADGNVLAKTTASKNYP